MKFGILGPIEAWCGGESLSLGGPRQIALLGFLLLHANRGVSRDALEDALWRGKGRNEQGKALDMAILRLRKALRPLDGTEGTLVHTVNAGYLLSASADDLDAGRFRALAQEGRAALRAADPDRAVERLRAALELWRGPPLAELAFEDFAQAEIRRLEENELSTREDLFDAELRLGHHTAVTSDLEALLEQHPGREHLAALVMLALYRAGRQADALETYQRTRSYLGRELGLDPGTALQRLQTQILEHAPGLGLVPVDERRPTPLPTGIVTMVLTEIDGSTRLLRELGDDYRELLTVHDTVLRTVWARHEGIEVTSNGDGCLAAFVSPRAAISAARDARDAIASARWPRDLKVCLRVAVHTGEPRTLNGRYWGEDVHYAGHVRAVCHGAQVLVSETAAALVPDTDLTDLGEHRLTDFPVPRRLFQLGTQRHPPLRTIDPLRSNLPGSPNPLIGRDADHSSLVGLIRAGSPRLVTIVGPGGVGKTRLALAVAESVVGDAVSAAFIVPLAQVDSADALLTAISAPLGVRLDATEDPVTALAVAVAGRPVLLVIDNFEHLLSAAPLLASLLEKAPAVHILVTSQAPLRLRAERVFPLGPLKTPIADSSENVEATAAGRLLLTRIRQLVPDFQMDDTNAPHLARLCRALDGLPLAIELAAGRLAVISPVDLLTRLQEGIEALGHGPRDLPARQQGLGAALEWTYRLLSDKDAAVLRRLGIFVGPVPLERIEQVCGDQVDVLSAIGQLVDFSLLSRAGDGTFWLHSATRAFAQRKLREAGEHADMCRRHAHAFARVADAWGRRFLLESDIIQGAAAREEADLGQALTWAADEDPECFARLVGGVALPLVFRSGVARWRASIEATLTVDTLPDDARAWLLLAATLDAWPTVSLTTARAHINSAVRAADRAGDAWLACLMRSCVVINQVIGESTPELGRDYADLVAHAESLGDAAFAAFADGMQAELLQLEDRHAEAEPLLGALVRTESPKHFAAWMAPYAWPDSLLACREYERALSAYLVALRVARGRVELMNIAYQLEGIALTLDEMGRHETALEMIGASESVRRSAGPIVAPRWAAVVDAAQERSRGALTVDVAARAFARGRARTVDAAVDAALALAPVSPLRLAAG